MAKNDELLDRLLAQYRSRSAYTPKTTEENKARAEDEYQSYYDDLRLAAQQQQERDDLALQQQREGLQRTYDQQREASAKDYRQAYSQADRQMLGRGMQRSSYAAQTLANIGQQGAEAQQKIWEAQGAAEGNIDAQREQLAEQLAARLNQYDTSKAADMLKRTRELDDQEYERAVADQTRRDQTGMQLANMLRQAERDQVSDEQFEKQFGLSKQQFEANLANQQWQQQYQEGRAKASDEQWAKQYGLSQKELEAQLANQQWQQQYQEGRAKASDEQWQRNYDFSAKKWEDQLAENLYQRKYQEGRDAVKDDQWAQELALQYAKLNAAGGTNNYSNSYSGGGSSGYSSYSKSSNSKSNSGNAGSGSGSSSGSGQSNLSKFLSDLDSYSGVSPTSSPSSPNVNFVKAVANTPVKPVDLSANSVANAQALVGSASEKTKTAALEQALNNALAASKATAQINPAGTSTANNKGITVSAAAKGGAARVTSSKNLMDKIKAIVKE